jgi:hypothetical protein
LEVGGNPLQLGADLPTIAGPGRPALPAPDPDLLLDLPPTVLGTLPDPVPVLTQPPAAAAAVIPGIAATVAATGGGTATQPSAIGAGTPARPPTGGAPLQPGGQAPPVVGTGRSPAVDTALNEANALLEPPDPAGQAGANLPDNSSAASGNGTLGGAVPADTPAAPRPDNQVQEPGATVQPDRLAAGADSDQAPVSGALADAGPVSVDQAAAQEIESVTNSLTGWRQEHGPAVLGQARAYELMAVRDQSGDVHRYQLQALQDAEALAPGALARIRATEQAAAADAEPAYADRAGAAAVAAAGADPGAAPGLRQNVMNELAGWYRARADGLEVQARQVAVAGRMPLADRMEETQKLMEQVRRLRRAARDQRQLGELADQRIAQAEYQADPGGELARARPVSVDAAAEDTIWSVTEGLTGWRRRTAPKMLRGARAKELLVVEEQGGHVHEYQQRAFDDARALAPGAMGRIRLAEQGAAAKLAMAAADRAGAAAVATAGADPTAVPGLRQNVMNELAGWYRARADGLEVRARQEAVTGHAPPCQPLVRRLPCWNR